MGVSFKAFAAAAAAIAISCTGTSAFAQNNSISAPFLTGIWKEHAQCRGNEAMVFFPNGTMSSAGSAAVNYTVTGASQIMMYGPGGTVPLEIRYVNQDKVILTMGNDATVLHRCASNFGAPSPVNPMQGHNAQLSNAYIVGGWGENGNCANPEVFSAGGHFRTSRGEPGTWALFGNRLRMTVNNGNSVEFSVQTNGPRNMSLTQGGGQFSHYQRCF